MCRGGGGGGGGGDHQCSCDCDIVNSKTSGALWNLLGCGTEPTRISDPSQGL